MSEKYMAVCRFCGQVIVTDGLFDSAADAVEYASRHCSCPDAKVYSEIETAKENACAWLVELEDSQKKLVCEAIAAVGFENAESVSIKLDGVYTVKIKKNGHDKLQLSITDKKTSNFEI